MSGAFVEAGHLGGYREGGDEATYYPEPAQLCECGCGLPAPVARVTNRKYGHVRGQATRFISGHNARLRGYQRGPGFASGSSYFVPLDHPDTYAIVDLNDRAAVEAFRWSLHEQGYAYTRIAGRPVSMHRRIMGLGLGDVREVDHIDGHGLDNRRRNLRIVSHAENAQNRRPRSRPRGVSYHAASGLWRARAMLAGRETCRYFTTKADAEAGAKALRAELFTHAVES